VGTFLIERGKKALHDSKKTREEFVPSSTKVQGGLSGSLRVWVIMAGVDEMVGI
jgi:hypothetical protein